MIRPFEKQLSALVGEGDCSVLMAVSGGVDSMVMASLFAASQYGKRAAIAHVNFQLRGCDSDADEALVQRWADSVHIPFYVQRFDTLSYARIQKCSVEMAARELRYQWFEELRQAIQMDWIAVAHNANDHAETVILNMIRGTGIRGLCGIPQKQGVIIRPMLHFKRSQIEVYAQNKQIPFREDTTNALFDFARNRIRHTVLPALAKINPSVVEQLEENARYIQQARNILEEEVEKKRGAWCRQEGDALFFKVEQMINDPNIHYWLFEILHPYGFGSGQIEQMVNILQAQPGRRVLSDTHILYKDRGLLALIPKKLDVSLPQVQVTLFDASTYPLGKNREIAALDADKLQFPLTLRRWMYGDRFIPFGMHGFKKVSDYLTDLRIPLWEKERQWVLCSGSDIVWVVRKRIDDRYKVNDKTEKVAEIILV